MNCDEFGKHILDYLTDTDFDHELKDKMEEHYFECDNCFNKLELTSATIGVIHSEGVDNLLQYFGNKEIKGKFSELSSKQHGESSLIPEGLKDLVKELSVLTSGAHFSCATNPYVPDPTRHDGLHEDTYYPGKQIVISVESPEKRDGFLTVFHYDDEYNLAMIFPSKPGVKTFLKAGIEKRIVIEAAKPLGKHYLKAIWTSKQIIDPEKVKLEDEAGTAALIETFLTSIHTLRSEDWLESVSEFEVTEK